MLETPTLIAVTVAAFRFGSGRLLRYLKYFQQETYDPVRFRGWMVQRRAFDKRGSTVAVGVGLLTLVAQLSGYHGIAAALSLFGALVLFTIPFLEEDPIRSGKVKLVLTQRATKIYHVALVLLTVFLAITMIALVGFQVPFRLTLAWIAVGLVAQGSPFLIIAANRLLKPAEQRVQDAFRRDAEGILARLSPCVIGITGSYGKTSTKAILGDLLNQCVAPTFWPRGSINTVMGITRDIRENMRQTHKFAIIEMGAYGIGSIQRLCRFTPPRAAIVTAVGLMHLERFGSQENIYKAKSELPQALPKDGVLVCNGDNPGARRMANEFGTSRTYLYGMDTSAGPLDCSASDITVSDQGTRFLIHWQGKSFPAFTPLLGTPAISNILAAFTMTCALGGQPAYVAAALGNLQPVENRLSIEKTKTAVWLKDAFNSNPSGFSAALDVLRSMKGDRKVLITPGMIELGDLQTTENERIAKAAGSIVDLAIVVGPTNREPILRGLENGGLAKEKIKVVDHRDEGFAYLRSIEKSGDVILVENDLPDLYEGTVQF